MVARKVGLGNGLADDELELVACRGCEKEQDVRVDS